MRTVQPSWVAIAMLLACCFRSFALNPSLDLAQYAHTIWTAREGLRGSIRSLVQTRDGYLWLGTEFGLARFDGVRFVPWTPPRRGLPSSNIRSLMAARDGTLWIGTVEGLASWKQGTLTQYPELAGQNVLTLLEDRQGTVWAGTFGTPNGNLCAVERGHMKCYGNEGIFRQWVVTLFEDAGGGLWAQTGSGLWLWKPGNQKQYSMLLPGTFEASHTVVQNDDGTGLLAIADGKIVEIVDGKTSEYRLPGVRSAFPALNLLRDRDSALWIGTQGGGLLRVHLGTTSVFAQSDGLSGDRILSLFEDREGNIWVGTADGLDCFREFTVPSISVKQGLSSATVETVLLARDKSVWLSTQNGLNRWNNGRVTVYRTARQPASGNDRMGVSQPAVPFRRVGLVDERVTEIRDPGLPDSEEVGSLFEDDRGRIWVSTPLGIARFESGRFSRVKEVPGGWVNTIVGDGNGGLWISYEDDGLVHLAGSEVVERIPWSKLGGNGVASAVIVDPVRGGLWLGFFKGGLVYFKDGQVRAKFGKNEGLGGGRVMGLQLDRGGTLWAATEGGLSRVRDGRVATLNTAAGLPCDTIHWVVQDDASYLWLYTACGLLRIARTQLENWPSGSGQAKIEFTVFAESDGVRSHALLTGYTPRVSKSPDGKLWFANFEGVSIVDPRHLPVNKEPPPVHIEQIISDRELRWQNLPGAATSNLRLPKLTRDLEIHYTALSLVAPEKIQFRYWLEGNDTDWQDAGNRRQAFYTNLRPGDYRFRVIACNNSGVWNTTGDVLEFSIAPAYYQTSWFLALCAAAAVAIFWALYRLRLYQLAREFSAQVDGRVDERMRVARELHDTLLQSFQASMIQMHAARMLFSRRPEKAVENLDLAIKMAEEGISEGRNAIQDLRAQPTQQGDLADLLTVTGQELAHSNPAEENAVSFHVRVEGERQALQPLLQDEVYRITRELLRNSFRHAAAHQIEAEIRYERRVLCVHVRDDGKGIDPEILKAGGREGHWGLAGMRERAKRLGARLDFWSEAGVGTEAKLTVPASMAYRAGTRERRFVLMRKKAGL